MNESSAFIRMISDNPDDDVPRLVYADWLEESGEELNMARAEFIRLDIRMHRLPPGDDERRELREKDWALMMPHAQAWWNELPKIEGLTWGWFERGFVKHVICRIGTFLNHAETIFEVAPIQSLNLTTITRKEIAAICDMECMNRITKLELARSWGWGPINQHDPYQFGNEEARRILNSPHLKRLSHLIVRCTLAPNLQSRKRLKKRFKQLVLNG
jgi:uncharacterized protein (TIGR02996 family)